MSTYQRSIKINYEYVVRRIYDIRNDFVLDIRKNRLTVVIIWFLVLARCIQEQDKHKTTFSVHMYGFYKCHRMVFGLANAPATFHRLTDVYMVGIIVCFVFDRIEDDEQLDRRVTEGKIIQQDKKECSIQWSICVRIGEWITVKQVVLVPWCPPHFRWLMITVQGQLCQFYWRSKGILIDGFTCVQHFNTPTLHIVLAKIVASYCCPKLIMWYSICPRIAKVSIIFIMYCLWSLLVKYLCILYTSAVKVVVWHSCSRKHDICY